MKKVFNKGEIYQKI